jgi:hypothetical protein
MDPEARTRSRRFVDLAVRLFLFRWLGLVLPTGLTHEMGCQFEVRRRELRAPGKVVDAIQYAFVAVHAYCVGFALFGDRAFLRWRQNRQDPGKALAKPALGALLLFAGYGLLPYAFLSCWGTG